MVMELWICLFFNKTNNWYSLLFCNESYKINQYVTSNTFLEQYKE